ncbi:MAG: InlB B-repeat-containing protein [Lachnospiraceae bacterium]|nr:InlB B-repeat-containing protein [Lachnospiraceae bacterium]
MKRFSYMFMAILMSISLMQVPVYANEIDQNNVPVVEENQDQENNQEEEPQDEGLPADTSNNEEVQSLNNESSDETETNETILTVDLTEGSYDGEFDNDKYFNDYVNRAFGIQDTPASTRRLLRSAPVTRGSQLSGKNKKLYDCLKTKIESVANGDLSSTEFVFSAEQLGISTAHYSSAQLGVVTIQNGSITREGYDALVQTVLGDLDVSLVVDALLSDYPYDLFWFDKTLGYISSTSVAGLGDELYIPAENSYTFKMYVAEDYRGGDVFTLDDIPARVNTAVTNAQNVITEYAGLSDYGKLLAYKEKICDLTSYNNVAANLSNNVAFGDPWQLINVFDGDDNTTVVCEGYSKAFKYLVDNSTFNSNDIACYLVSGTMQSGSDNGPHMWNIVTMDDNNNYLVDVTNCDSGSIGAPDKLFLKGYKNTCEVNYSDGTTGIGYVFQGGSDDIYYSYDADTLRQFSDTERSISGSNYNTSTSHIVSVFKNDVIGNQIPGNITGTGYYAAGENVTLTASAVSGYNFVGWYNHSDSSPYYTGGVLCSTNAYTFTVSNDLNLTAVYEARGTASLSINGGSSYTVNGVSKSNNIQSAYQLGSQITLATTADNFECWQNSYGRILSRSNSYTFTVTGPDTITAVYNNITENMATIIFESDYGQIMAKDQLAENGTMTIPVVPTKNGYTALGWDMNGDDNYDPTTDNIAAAISRGLSAANKTVTIRAIYVINNSSYTITVTNGTGSNTYNQNALVTVTADAAPSGQKFSHWKDSNNNTLSYNSTYEFYAEKNLSLEAVYVAQDTVVNAVGTTDIINKYKNESINGLVFVSMSTVPQGCTINKAGVIATNNPTTAATENTFVDTADGVRVRGDAWSGTSYRYTWTISNNTNGSTWYVRAYLKYTDASGNVVTKYGPIVSQTY